MQTFIKNLAGTERVIIVSIDLKTAQHECNVIKRMVMRCYPRLQIQFILHKENEREKAFATESRQLTNHPAGQYIFDHPDKISLRSILKKNQSRFVCIAKQDNPGFLGFFKQKSYLALCFINYTHFESIETLRNHAYHIAWHAIALRNDYESANSAQKRDNEAALKFTDEHDILIPDLAPQELYHRNLLGDIFSACIQAIIGREKAFDILAKQRIANTLSASSGFCAEQFPFPMCIDTLEHVFKNNIEQYKKSKRQTKSAVEITEDIGATFEPTSIEKWRSFSVPAQQMAWTGNDAQTILGAAFYTGENTYAQSIADMIAERLSIKPQLITSFQDYNPFTNQEANARMHRKICLDLLYNLLARLIIPEDHQVVVEVIEKQNLALLEGKAMGWCVPALIPIEELIRKCPDKSMMSELTSQATTLFEKEINEMPWESLVLFYNIIFERRRKNETITMQDLLDITADNEELSSIHYGLAHTQNFNKKTAPLK